MYIKEILILFNLSGRVPPSKIKYIFETLSVNARKDFSLKELKEITEEAGISKGAEKEIFSPESLKLLQSEIETSRKEGIEIVTLADSGYPRQLRNIYDPPPVIYVKGTLRKEFFVSIVGSRRASLYGRRQATKIAFNLGRMGLSIVSGLARGIDTFAHKGALQAGGTTIAVLGSGLLCLYPPENRSLAYKIVQQGALVSEFPLHTPPFSYNFPRRNRIISGMSEAVIVVEAAKRSGALITADFALEQGKEVFALPGNIDSPTSLGCIDLLKQGAHPFVSVEDIIEIFPHLRQFCSDSPSVKAKLSNQEKEIISFLERPRVFDEILEKLNLDVSQLYRLLLDLKMKSFIEELPGKRYVRT